MSTGAGSSSIPGTVLRADTGQKFEEWKCRQEGDKTTNLAGGWTFKGDNGEAMGTGISDWGGGAKNLGLLRV